MCRVAWKREPEGGQCGQAGRWCCGGQLGTKGPLIRPLVLALRCSPMNPGVMRNVTMPIRTSPSGATSTACTARAAAAETGCASMCFLRKHAFSWSISWSLLTIQSSLMQLSRTLEAAAAAAAYSAAQLHWPQRSCMQAGSMYHTGLKQQNPTRTAGPPPAPSASASRPAC